MQSKKQLKNHLTSFINAFIARERKERWVEFLISKPEKAPYLLSKFENHQDPRYCRYIEGAGLHTESLEKLCGPRKGLYFDGVHDARIVGVEGAALAAWETGADSIFSIIPGRRAIFFFHEDWAWYCERDT